MAQAIDFVIPWVDGSDPVLREKMFRALPPGAEAATNRYRDWELLNYWFRAVEQFAPWVNRIHLITSNQCPSWLNTNHPKLNLVFHEDYIPGAYLPCFSSHPIELNMHRIPGLAEHFVYFNDDMFLLRPVTPDLFFKKGLVCELVVRFAPLLTRGFFLTLTTQLP